MANQPGAARRNGVIGFQMTGAPTPAVPRSGPHRNGPVGFQMVPGPSPHATSSSSSSSSFPSSSSSSSHINQGPPHRITPLVGPDTALSHLGQTTFRPSPSQQQFNTLSERLAEAEQIIHRQESELNDARSQASALKAQMATQRSTTRFLDQHQMDAMIQQSNGNRSRDIDAQLGVLEDRLNQASEEEDLVKDRKLSLETYSKNLSKDREDLQELRQIVTATEYNVRRQERLAGAEVRLKGLLKTLGTMHASAMENTRASQVQTRSAPIAESQTNPVIIALQHVLGRQEPGSQGHVWFPSSTSKGKERDPGPVYADPSDPSTSSGSCRSSRAGSPMELTEDPGHELAAPVVAQQTVVQEAPSTTFSIAPQHVETNDMMELNDYIFDCELAQLNGEAEAEAEAFDGYMEWEFDTNAGSQASNTNVPSNANVPSVVQNHASAVPGSQASTVQAPSFAPIPFSNHDMLVYSGQGFDLTIGPITPTTCNFPPRRLARNIVEGLEIAVTNPTMKRRHDFIFKRADRLVGSRRRYVPRRLRKIVKLAGRKRISRAVGFSEDEGPSRKKRITREKVKANGSLLLSQCEAYVMNTAPKVPAVSVPAVSQPAQSVHVSTEEVSTQLVTSEPAVSQPTLTNQEYTESALIEEAPIQAALSEPAVSQPTRAVLEYTETVSTEQVPTEATMSAPAVPQPTQVVLEATKQGPVDAALSEPAVSQPTQAASEEIETVETVQVCPEAVTSEPAVPQPTQTALESTVPESSVPEPPVSITSDEVVGVPAPSEPAPTKSAQTKPSSAEKIPSVPAVTKPTRNDSDLTWQPEDELVVPSLRTGTRSHLDVLLARRATRTQARPTIMSSSEGLQVTATPRDISTSSLVASPEDASVKNAVATGTDSRAGVSKGAKRVEDAENLTCSAQQSAGEQREEMGGEEAATSGLQMPGAWPSDPPAVTASDESEMQEGSAVLRGLWTGTRWLSFGVFVMVMVILLSFPLWADHLGHLVYALEGPEQFLEELRWEHGYDVPFLERIIYVFLRCFAGDRTLFG
ncbi:uncharacterized protein N7479_005827 [Penicillium vulpinum]|uniref:Uncharacterized protein n=1 Tax=Penicillium vulpinum TaxID=29845 RepID=A0A1V6SFE4_9EURO|nr:uncharacterized protein N7479_005827 [Penicillium vulpinum]KAJ5958677.1 hypothetical protein N7479_005827 [Penicillium vulpinum]OQE12490.1 hypothetical protein PENVUL_c001G10278 [Penicillium vulpinum]